MVIVVVAVEPVRLTSSASAAAHDAEKSVGAHSYPCVVEMVDQMALARLHAKPRPKVHNLSDGWAAMLGVPGKASR